ncbi:cytosolic 5'-nucleotidase 1A-like, partial [Gracilinanus agilis]|uniref:cytosolic 5'-nucleotidase 1A-like n=1 Tax=Gracilinanus agilis TaxID=191870 RepID=UPI001CFCD1B3
GPGADYESQNAGKARGGTGRSPPPPAAPPANCFLEAGHGRGAFLLQLAGDQPPPASPRRADPGVPESGRRDTPGRERGGPPGAPGLEISKFCFVSEEDSTEYLRDHNVGLFLSADRTDVCNALKRGVPAALIFQQEVQAPSTQLRLAFDGDAVLFSDETDRVFQEQGLQGALRYERAMEAVPIGEGPMKAFAMQLGHLRDKFGPDDSPVCTYLVTARSEGDMSLRALNTLRAWGLRLDQVFFMDGAPKGPTLARIRPHIFFDDSMHNIQGAQDASVPSALVPCGC